MWPFTSKRPQTLSEEFVTRYWDLEARVSGLETKLEERLEELQRRYQRAEQAERRLDAKRIDPDQLELADDEISKVRRLQRGTS